MNKNSTTKNFMQETNENILEAFIETVESSFTNREKWLERVGKSGLTATLEEYEKCNKISTKKVK